MRIIKHSFLMIKKTFNNYLLLSVTAFLSFAIMFGYLIYTDSEEYNKYKVLFSNNPNIILSMTSTEDKIKLKAITKQLEKLSNTYYYYQKQSLAQTSYGKECEVNLLPSYIWGLYISSNETEESRCSRAKINEKYEVSLGINDAIVSEQIYAITPADKNGEKKLELVFTNYLGEKVKRTYNIVASYSNDVYKFKDLEKDVYIDPVFLNMASVSETECAITGLDLIIYTEQKNFVIQQLKESNLPCYENYSLQNEAIGSIKGSIFNKYIIATVLFILLGINLYSSFTNALNDRKFEIGVKRAIGAKKSSIMLQFVTEGLTVMFANTIFSVWCVLNLMNFYKFVKEIISYDKYIVTISIESILLFIIFTFFLTLIFSLLFAYKSTKVEIVKYLKEEL